ncbi:hypothetical protein [Cylindrospermopsis raciborskii]|uniref:hypothetical protein n=1 Tax=Cylindrospermopsis raciborskii TaxID=77022 RepID=UPI0026E9C8D2|nr:hypothetical protein [Cylindrospermopsis raciborskii]
MPETFVQSFFVPDDAIPENGFKSDCLAMYAKVSEQVTYAFSRTNTSIYSHLFQLHISSDKDLTSVRKSVVHAYSEGQMEHVESIVICGHCVMLIPKEI